MNENSNTNGKTIILAGSTGNLGGRIARHLIKRGATVRAIVRPGSNRDKVRALQHAGASIVASDFKSVSELSKACKDAACVVSALSGLEEAMLEAQRVLLYAAVEAGVPRFIPSDFAIDFTKLPHGSNRNFTLRQEFRERLDRTPIAATSIFNGMFSDLLTGQAPVVVSPISRVVYWGDPDQLMDFTTVENTAAFTAAAALDSTTPRYLSVAGDVLSARGLVKAASEVTGKEYKLLRAGSLQTLHILSEVMRIASPKSDEVFPPWQGMQYTRDMFSGRGKLEILDNGRYSGIQWTTVQEVLAGKENPQA